MNTFQIKLLTVEISLGDGGTWHKWSILCYLCMATACILHIRFPLGSQSWSVLGRLEVKPVGRGGVAMRCGRGRGSVWLKDEPPEPPSNHHRTTPKYRTTTIITVLHGEFGLISIKSVVRYIILWCPRPVFKYLIYFLFCYKYIENNVCCKWRHLAYKYTLSKYTCWCAHVILQFVHGDHIIYLTTDLISLTPELATQTQ